MSFKQFSNILALNPSSLTRVIISLSAVCLVSAKRSMIWEDQAVSASRAWLDVSVENIERGVFGRS